MFADRASIISTNTPSSVVAAPPLFFIGAPHGQERRLSVICYFIDDVLVSLQRLPRATADVPDHVARR